MNTAQLTPRAHAVIADSGETGEPIFRTPCSVGSGEVATSLTPREQTLLAALVKLCNSYAFIKPPGYPKSDAEKQAEAAIAAATEGAV